jgi:hypothetical protein
VILAGVLTAGGINDVINPPLAGVRGCDSSCSAAARTPGITIYPVAGAAASAALTVMFLPLMLLIRLKNRPHRTKTSSAAAATAAAAATFPVFSEALGLSGEEICMQHSLSYLSQAFSMADGRPIQRIMIDMADWPLSLHNEAQGIVSRISPVVQAVVPSFFGGEGRGMGVRPLWEGKHARHMRLVQQLEGYRPAFRRMQWHELNCS